MNTFILVDIISAVIIIGISIYKDEGSFDIESQIVPFLSTLKEKGSDSYECLYCIS